MQGINKLDSPHRGLRAPAETDQGERYGSHTVAPAPCQRAADVMRLNQADRRLTDRMVRSCQQTERIVVSVEPMWARSD